jgi:nitroreductase
MTQLPEPSYVPLRHDRLHPEESRRRAEAFVAHMRRRRTTRHFSRDPVPRELIECAIAAAGTAPSGAHQQPWTSVAVSDASLKARLRAAAEEEEARNYAGRMPPEWLEAIAPLGTDEHKPHLTDAPWVVVMFRKLYGRRSDGRKRPYYYTQESCGIAAGVFICAVHEMGLVTLTHTPSPMGFLSRLLDRPEDERPFLVMPVGYPAPEAQVPDLSRKRLEEIAIFR